MIKSRKSVPESELPALSQKKPSRLQCLPSQLTGQEVWDLLSPLFGHLGRIVRHDLRNRLSSFRNTSEVMINEVSQLVKNERPESSESALAEVQELALTLKTSANHLETHFRPFFDLFSYEQSTIGTHIGAILSNICMENPKRVLLDASCDSSLEILMPSNLVFGIFAELTNNALKHAVGQAPIWLCWSIKGSEFVGEVHDPGEKKIKSGGFMPYQVVFRPKRGMGLSVLTSLIVGLKGSLLFGTSDITGGVLARFSFPVRAFASSRFTS
jgi:K+-sensing histidine kinase KdpD